jgi:hypothetical protein
MKLRLLILTLLALCLALAVAPFVVGQLAHATITPLGVFNYLLLALKLTLGGAGLAVYFFTRHRDDQAIY